MVKEMATLPFVPTRLPGPKMTLSCCTFETSEEVVELMYRERWVEHREREDILVYFG